jgi:hypothetical protein
MDDDNPFRSPQSYDAPRTRPTNYSGAGLWRDSTMLVLRKEAELPDRCMACNQPADGRRLKQTFYWHPPAYYLLVLINLIVYVLVAMMVRKSAKLEIGICERHQRQRFRAAIVGWVGTPLGILAIASAGASRSGAPTFLIVGIGLLLFSLIFAIVRRQLVSPKRIDRNFVWLKGVHPDYLTEYPDWPGPVDALLEEAPAPREIL